MSRSRDLFLAALAVAVVLDGEIERLRRIEAAARVVDAWNRKRQPFRPAAPFAELRLVLGSE